MISESPPSNHFVPRLVVRAHAPEEAEVDAELEVAAGRGGGELGEGEEVIAAGEGMGLA